MARIELDPGAQPVAGRILPPTGEPLAFSGYVELIAALELIRLADQPERDRDGDSEPGAPDAAAGHGDDGGRPLAGST